jgi:hypothetical protein
MIKLTTLLIEQKYKYNWVPLQQALPANAVNGYRLKYKEQGEGALVDESDLKYIFSDSRFATKYKNKDYVFYISEVRGTSKKKVYIAYVYRRDNLPANIKLFFTLGIGPTFTLNGVPVFLSSQEKEVAGKRSGIVTTGPQGEAGQDGTSGSSGVDGAKGSTGTDNNSEEELIAAEKAAAEAKANAEAEAKKAEEKEKRDNETADNETEEDKTEEDETETTGIVRITAGYKVPPYIQKIAKDIHTAANYIGLGGTNTELFDSAFDKIKKVQDAFLVNLELARLKGKAAYDLEYVIRDEFSIWSGADERLLKLSRLVGIDDNGDIHRPDKSLMKQAAKQHFADQKINISRLGWRNPGESPI